MKKLSTRLAALCLSALFLFFGPASQSSAAGAQSPGQVDILFLHDTHSHLNSFLTVEEGQDVTLGGFARLKTLIDRTKEHNPDTLVLDAGDFSMGTLIQTIFHTDAPELRMLGALGCDVSTLGNHEFDYRSSGLAGALDAAVNSKDPLPALVLCNIDWETMEADGLTPDQQLLKDAFARYGMKDYVVIDKGGLKIAVFGVFGEDSLACAPTCVLKFQDITQAAQATVKEIQEKENVDMILCVSHSGTDPDSSKSEDELLAKAVPEIDLIVSGHSHTSLSQPIQYDNTYIVSCGSYGRNLGALTMSRRDDGRWDMDAYELIPVTEDLPPHEATQEKIDSLMEKVDSGYLAPFGYTRSQILALNSVSFSTSDQLYTTHTEHNLGSLLADAFAYGVEQTQGPGEPPVDVAIVPSGCVRDTFATGPITVEDVFNAYSLGIGPDGVRATR